MNTHTALLKYLKFNNILICSKELDSLFKEKDINKRKKLLQEAENCVIDAISELAKNCLAGNIPLSTTDFNNLSKYQNILRKISRKSPENKRRKLLIQNGGVLNVLIPQALMLISTIIGEIIKKRLNKKDELNNENNESIQENEISE